MKNTRHHWELQKISWKSIEIYENPYNSNGIVYNLMQSERIPTESINTEIARHPRSTLSSSFREAL